MTEQKKSINKKEIWYKSPAIIISILSFLFTTGAFLYNNHLQSKERELSSIENHVKELNENIEKLATHMSQAEIAVNDPKIDNNARISLGINYNTLTNVLLDKILINYDSIIAKRINSNLLLCFASGLELTGRNELSENVFKTALKFSKDNIDSGIIHRYLANLYARESKIKNIEKSRFHRRQTIALQERNQYIKINNSEFSRTYELWALDEYYCFGNKQKALNLIDSALYYLNILPEFNQNKVASENRLKDFKLYILKGINKYDLPKNWKVNYDKGALKGYANIYKDNMGTLLLEMGLYFSNTLTMKIKGQGSFTKFDELHFDISACESVNCKLGDLDLKIVDKDNIRGKHTSLGFIKKDLNLIRENE